jgi:copper(I)-binding protein
MVSRRSTGPLRTILPAVRTILPTLTTGLVAGVVALGIAGCSSGQVTQTDSVQPAVNGNQGNVGDVALRDVLVAYPESGAYDMGDDAPLTLTIVNTGGMDDELTSVSSPAATKVELMGKGALPARSGLQVIIPEEPTETSEPATSEPSATESAPPSESSEPSSETSAPETTSSEPSETETAPEDVGTMSLVLTGLTKDLPIGKNVPVTFVFAKAGEITLNVPIASPDEVREDTGSE